jgi:hypothetical protein
MRRSLVLALLVAVACGERTTEPVAVAGTYRLSRVDGLLTPAPLPGGVDGAAARVSGGTATLEADGRWRAEVRIDVDANGAAVSVNQLFAGTYTVSRDTVRLRDASDGALFIAVVRGARLTATVDGTTFDFDR